MLSRKVSCLIVVHNGEIYWIEMRDGRQGRCVLQLPVDQFIENPSPVRKLSQLCHSNYRALCLIPDHWFGIETYPFRSKRAGLIEPFLERRLTAAYPEKKSLSFFYNYKTTTMPENGDGVMAFFLNDDIAYQLNDALKSVSLAPRWFSCAGFLWGGVLEGAADGFGREGTLLIHLNETECLLYFFYKGDYLFSRHVILPDLQESLDAVVYEINQSLYLFSQKTKSELSRFFLYSTLPVPSSRLSEALGREIVLLNDIIDDRQTLEVEHLPFLNGLLRPRDIGRQAEPYSIVHRKVRRDLFWQPVQWAAMIVGLFLVIALIGNSIFLSSIIRDENNMHRLISHQNYQPGEMPLNEYAVTLDRVLERSSKPTSSGVLASLLEDFPETIRISEINCDFSAQPVLAIEAEVSVEAVSQLKSVLNQLVAQLKSKLHINDSFSINDIQVRGNHVGQSDSGGSYMISLKLDLL